MFNIVLRGDRVERQRFAYMIKRLAIQAARYHILVRAYRQGRMVGK